MKKQSLQIHSFLSELTNNDSDKKRYNEYFSSPTCTAFRELLIKYLEKRIMVSVARSDASTNYDKPAWSEYQAAEAGAREEDRLFIRLLKGIDNAG